MWLSYILTLSKCESQVIAQLASSCFMTNSVVSILSFFSGNQTLTQLKHSAPLNDRKMCFLCYILFQLATTCLNQQDKLVEQLCIAQVNQCFCHCCEEHLTLSVWTLWKNTHCLFLFASSLFLSRFSLNFMNSSLLAKFRLCEGTCFLTLFVTIFVDMSLC